MIGNRAVVLGLAIACSVLAGCIGAPFEPASLGEAVAQEGGGSLESLGEDAGNPSTDGGSRVDSGPVAEKVDAGADAEPHVVDGGPDADAGSRSDAAPVADGGSSCDGGPVYLHHAGLDGVTWQDCVPTGTYDAAQALAACEAYADVAKADAGASYADAAGAALCDQRGSSAASCPNMVQYGLTPIFWTYAAGTGGHVVVSGSYTQCSTSVTDPTWD